MRRREPSKSCPAVYACDGIGRLWREHPSVQNVVAWLLLTVVNQVRIPVRRRNLLILQWPDSEAGREL